MDTLLLETLLALYHDCPEITEALKKLDFSKVNYKFQQELFLRIEPIEFYKMDAIVHSDEYRVYRDAIDRACLACTQELSSLLNFVIESGGALQ